MEEEKVDFSIAEWLSAFPPPFTDNVLNGLNCTVSTKKFLKRFLEVLFGNDWHILDQFLLDQCTEPCLTELFPLVLLWFNRGNIVFDVLITFFHDVTCILDYQFGNLVDYELSPFLNVMSLIAKEKSTATVRKQLCYIGRIMDHGLRIGLRLV